MTLPNNTQRTLQLGIGKKFDTTKSTIILNNDDDITNTSHTPHTTNKTDNVTITSSTDIGQASTVVTKTKGRPPSTKSGLIAEERMEIEAKQRREQRKTLKAIDLKKR
ncbi:hypothetical protein BC941DRAFT_475731 [Chlamydoabsidia padenii]|nr:hypothetical protein BC941DRAFT_475731 [Chlamydoabsidia padenii]